MSSHLAVATVTATLRRRLQAAIVVDVPDVDATVTTTRPTDTKNGGGPAPGVNIFLYQVTANPAWRNADLPSRSADGRLVQRPQVALNLDYLLSFSGDEAQLVPQRLLGSVVRAMHVQPVLNRALIQETIEDPSLPYLQDATLADQVEPVKFTPITLSMEEVSKLWSVFLHTPYALSVTYQASVVLIESDDTPQPAAPVTKPQVDVQPFHQADGP